MRPIEFNLDFRPNAQLLPIVRKFVAEFYERLLDPDAVSRVVLATHELLENAIKYSSDGLTRVQISVTMDDGASAVAIRISNRAKPEDIEVISAIFDEMKVMPDPFEHYQLVMRRNAKREHGSGLGLVRVRAEGEMVIHHEVNDGEVSIFAETSVERRAA